MVFFHRRPRRHCVLLLLLVLLQALTPACFSDDTPSPEIAALLLLKNSFTNATSLSSWTNSTGGGPCDSRWDGVICQKGSVAGLDLSGIGLSGAIDVDALAQLANLRTISFADNNFAGSIPALNRLHTLRAIYLSRNRFSGDIPGDFFDDMTHLKRLCINDNDFTGLIPYSLSQASAIMELQLQNNQFAGTIPALVLPSLSVFNVSNNELEGVIPDVYSKFNASSFLGNENLCGELQFGDKPCKETVASNGKVAAIFMLFIFLICLVVYFLTTREQKGEEPMDLDALSNEKGMEAAKEVRFRRIQSIAKEEVGQSRRMGSAENNGAGGGGGAGDLVMVNEVKGVFGLPELMKASAEVMGGGGIGSAYKAVMTSGVAVVVKRMRDMNRVGKEAFDGHLRRLGSLNHPNLLPPLAYHYRKDEKLFVYEYIPKGSLLYVLHGDRGLDHASLDWPTRAKIAKGVARGLAYLHDEFPSDEAAAAAPHGNLKSGNVLLAPDFEPLLVDYGFLPLLNPSAMTMQVHRAPEVAGGGGPATLRSDVFCLGVVLLELLTGKFPSQYLGDGAKAGGGGGGGTDVVHWATYAVGEGREAEILDPAIVAGPHAAAWVPEMKRLVGVGVDCSAAEPERRIELREAVARIEEVAERVAAGVRDGVGERPS